MHLQRAAGNAAVGRLVARRVVETIAPPVTAHAVQRDVVTGDDPLVDMLKEGSKSLLYGNSTARKHTSLRGQLGKDSDQWNKEKRTIDAYNDEIGLSKWMAAAEPQNVLKVREVLATKDPVTAWGAEIPPDNKDYDKDPDLVAWINQMKARADYVGLYDLGAEAAAKPNKASLKAVKSRHKKNFISKGTYKNRQAKLTPAFIHQWLDKGRTFASADADVKQLTNAEKSELAKWITKAFWRRTSKLGIDFTVNRGFTIHMNTAADKDFDFSKAVPPKLKAGDLKKIKERYGRMITTSEYRHIMKGIKNGTIDPNHINLYDEISH